MRERCMETGASSGEEAVSADSWREGEISAGGGGVRKATFSGMLLEIQIEELIVFSREV